jgi:uncharacterized protein (TIGR03032 family)
VTARADQRHAAAWRDPAAVASHWRDAGGIGGALVAGRVTGPWWELLRDLGVTLLVSREYEHFVLAMRAGASGPRVSFFPLPHPSGIAVDARRSVVHVASTRNPNQVFTFAPAVQARARIGTSAGWTRDRPLLPAGSSFYAGCLYLHDLAMIGGGLVGTATGENAVVRLAADGQVERVWWPRCIERGGRPVFGANHIQLNSIAAGPSLASSFFAASSLEVGRRRPGHRNYPVDGRGVVFSGATREPIAFGLTRPHSLRRDGRRLFVANSGYGEFGTIAGERFEPIARLPGWTRGVCLSGRVAFVGTSRVIPRFRAYAPGVDVARSVCGVHAVDLRSGATLASIRWPGGNQIFAIEQLPNRLTGGFPLTARRHARRERDLFHTFSFREQA